jgi:hypothetical protein
MIPNTWPGEKNNPDLSVYVDDRYASIFHRAFFLKFPNFLLLFTNLLNFDFRQFFDLDQIIPRSWLWMSSSSFA